MSIGTSSSQQTTLRPCINSIFSLSITYCGDDKWNQCTILLIIDFSTILTSLGIR